MQHLSATLEAKADETRDIVKTGRTHLMDAMPVTLGQELDGWRSQVDHGAERLTDTMKRLTALAQGGTAVGTGINAHPKFGRKVAVLLNERTGVAFHAAENQFESLSCQDAAVETSGQLRTLAVSLTKIANDLRWMNSGPLAGIGEIALPALQPGSSIMPGKVNPVIPEAVAMVAAQVIGNDTTITMGGQSGNFQLNVMLPVVAYNLLQSIEILANACVTLADKAIAGFTVNEEQYSPGARPQSDPGHGAEPGHRLREGRGRRQEGLRRRPCRQGRCEGNDRSDGRRTGSPAGSGGADRGRYQALTGWADRPLTADALRARFAGTQLPADPLDVVMPPGHRRWPQGMRQKLNVPLKPAGVLVPMIERDAGLSVLLTQRAPHLKHHAGQVSFPGGSMEAHDQDVLATALRETHEEVGIPPDDVDVIGYLRSMPTITGFAVTPVIGLVGRRPGTRG